MYVQTCIERLSAEIEASYSRARELRNSGSAWLVPFLILLVAVIGLFVSLVYALGRSRGFGCVL